MSIGSDIPHIEMLAVLPGEEYAHAASVVDYVVDRVSLDSIGMVALLLDLDAYEVAADSS
jgi:hypothetical protein